MLHFPKWLLSMISQHEKDRKHMKTCSKTSLNFRKLKETVFQGVLKNSFTTNSPPGEFRPYTEADGTKRPSRFGQSPKRIQDISFWHFLPARVSRLHKIS